MGSRHKEPTKWSELVRGVAQDGLKGGVSQMGPRGVSRRGGVRIDRDAETSACTNQRNRGRTSADRSTKATLMLTVPRSLIKSSTKDLT